MKILGTGLNGLVGSRILDLLSDRYAFENLSRGSGVDITDFSSILKAMSSSDAKIVFHAAAYTDVKTAEKEKELGEKSEAWMVNVVGTQNVAKACEQTGKKMIYVSTDMVLGGDNMPEGGFPEDSVPNPLSWYAVTKYEGEKIINKLTTPWVIMRTAYPYRASFAKPDFARVFKQWLSEGKSISVLTDRIITPTFIDDIAGAFDILVQKNATGIYHVVGSQILSIYDAALLIAKIFGLDNSLIKKTTREQFLVGRPPEPFSSALNNVKIKQLGAQMHTFEEGLLIINKNI